MKTSHLIRTMALVLVLLVGGTSATDADDENFSLATDTFYWEYDFQAVPSEQSVGQYLIHGEVLIITDDDASHKVAEWKLEDSRSVSYTVTDRTWGTVLLASSSDMTETNRKMSLRLLPNSRCFEDGVKRIVARYSAQCYIHYLHDYVDFGDYQYAKNINMSSVVNEDKPLPKLQVDWTDGECLSLTALNVPNHRGNVNYQEEYYQLQYDIIGDYAGNARMWNNRCYHTKDFDVISDHGNGTYDISTSFQLRPGSSISGAYFYPVYIHYYRNTSIRPIKNLSQQFTISQPVDEITVAPFTRPTTLDVVFDKWNRKNTVSWTRNERARGLNRYKGWMYEDCRFDGKWYVIRYEKGQAPGSYKLLSTFKGDETTLKLEDIDIDYDKEYVYRVIFLPSPLEDTYKDNLVSGVLNTPERFVDNFWIEKGVSTKLEMPIKLWQDRTVETAVHLVWEYCIQPTGQNWTIECSPAGKNTWRVLDNSLQVDPNKSEVTFDAEGTVCDQMDYRVKTSYVDRDFYSNIITGNLPAGSYISEVKASTGTEENTVIVKWKVARADVQNDISFRVLRRAVGTDEWTLLTDEIHGTASEYSYIDNRPLAGSYYEYTVEAYGAKCDDQLVKTDAAIVPGFSQARGTITGHIAYGTGTAVAGAKVNLIKSTADEGTDQPQYLSRYIEGPGKGLQWTAADKEQYNKVINGDGAFTLQFWARPMSEDAGGAANQTILRLGYGLELGVRSDDGTHFYLNRVIHYDNRLNSHHFNKSLPFSTTDFTHVTAVYDHGMLTCYVGTDSLLSYTLDCTQYKDWNIGSDPTLAVGGIESMYAGMGQSFNGYIDDIRLWNRALSKEEVEANYTRILGGTEDGLVLYWPLDEGLSVVNYAFDVSRQDGIYQLNHPVVGVNAQPSASVPQRLSLYGVTDQEGDYIIKGIPFQQGGTNYKLAPELGIHEFSPNSRSMFVSPTSLTANNIDFEDVSSFPMEGYVYYAGTNIPAEGIQFYVDGDLVTADGKVQQTNANGYYQISVPIGQHFVEAKLANHKMVGGGRFPDTGKYNFDRAVTHDFADSTLVNFVGRIGGGERNDTLAVGFGASKNNIGIATVTLKLNNESLSFNCQDGHITTATAVRSFESDTTAIRSKAWTGYGADSKYIYIRTDSLTGEFSAKLPPLKYTTKSIRIDKNPDIEFTTLPEIDLTNVLKEVKDSLKQLSVNGDSVFNYYKYHTKMVKAYYSNPIVELSQPKSEAGVFGLHEYNGEDKLGKFTVSDLWTKQDNGTVTYKYGYPIYNMGDKYRMTFFGYERYLNYDSGQPVEDIIPLNGKVLTVANEMSSDQAVVCVPENGTGDVQPGQVVNLKKNQLALDSVGRATIEWTVGPPNVVSPYTRHVGITLERSGRTFAPASLNAIVVGSLPLGNNFVTNGPDQLLMVLRDPPGAKSKTVWKRGKTKATIKTTADGGYGDEKVTYTTNLGIRLQMLAGFGLCYQTTDLDHTIDFGAGLHYKWSKDSSNETTWTTTTTQDVSTSTDKNYCGSRGDVYIGLSTNLLMGQCRKVGFFRDSETAPFTLKDDMAVSLGDSVTTNFMYSAYEIEEVMIPKWRETRNGYLTQHFDTEAEARAFVNNTSEVLYATWVKEDDTSYGQEGTYVMVIPEEWKLLDRFVAENKVMWCNNQIESWKQVMAVNERDKVQAMSNHDNWLRNISFDGGSSYSYTNKADTTTISKSTYTHNLGGIIKTGFSNKDAALGMQFKSVFAFDSENGWSHSESSSDKEGNWAEFDYIFDDGNKGTDFSVDIYKSPGGWSDIFSLFGGQSYNPYEAEEKTKYYEPGQHTLSNGTVRMENPDIKISTDGGIASKEATLTDVPAGQTAQFTLHLSNIRNTNQDFDFSYNIMVQEKTNQQGLEILMDGVPANGRSIFVPGNETVKKVITVRQTDQSVLDYEGIEIWFNSQYQPIKINDKCILNVHFKPSSSPIDLAISEPVLNTESKDGQLEMKLTNFDRQFKNLKNVGVQYRFEGSTAWTDLHTWVTDKADSTSTAFSSLPPTGDIRYAADMSSDLSYPEGNYEFRAFTTTPYGTEIVHLYSDIVVVIKDMTRPRNLFTPSPTNGILGYGDQLSIEFNEDIVPGYVGNKNVIVTAKLNQQTVNHEVALSMRPFGETPMTMNPVFLNGDFAMDFWLNWHDSGTILHQGNMMALGIEDDGRVTADIVGNTITSSGKLPKDEWIFFALSYHATTMTFDVLAQYGTQTVELFKNQPVTTQEVQNISYTDDNLLYLGGINADIHALSLYNIWRDVHEAATTKYQAKDGYVYGLVNYWPMDEGHGHIAADQCHTHDFIVPDSWKLENVNYALRIDDSEGAQADITRINTSRGDSYAIELWYSKGNSTDSTQPAEEVVFETATPTVVGDQLSPNAKLRLRYDEGQNLVLDYGQKSLTVASLADFPDPTGWRHLALNVVRGQAASFYLNGQRTAVIAEADIPPLAGAALFIGKGTKFAYADELRIWHAALSERRLTANIYNTIDTADVYSRGLVAYYPFEKTGTENGATTKVPTLSSIARTHEAGTTSTDITPASTFTIVQDAPPLKNAPDETRLIASPVASERKVVINLTGAGISPRDIEGTTLNVTVDQVRDLHGNTSLPIRWTAYVQQNTLKWTRDSVNVIKKYGDNYTFDVDIENKGGNTEYYTIYNMPQWLSLVGSTASDEINPLSTKVLRFQVNPLVPVGNYDVTIGVQGNNQILEPLRVVMKVRGEKPQWTVDPTLYEHQMNYIGQVRIGGILIENSESMVAAFIGDECRGVASPERVRGAAYVTMTVYGNGDTDAGKPVSFRIWDASAGIAYTDVNINAFNGSPVDNTFQLNAVRGSFDQPVIWTKGDNVEQNLKLTTNWNWVSLGVRPADQRPAAVFPLLTPWEVFIKDKASTMIFSDGDNWMPENAQIQAATMYKVKITPVVEGQQLPEQVPVTGEQLKLKETPVTLTPGWNWIGYTPLTTMTVGEALAAANPQAGDCVKSQHSIAFYSQNGWEGSLKALESGHGYMYNSTAVKEKSFVYPDATGTRRAAAKRTLLNAESQSESQKTRLFAPTVGNYPDNMSMVIALKDGEQSVDTCEVAAYIGGECRGATRANGGLYYLIIAGEGSGQPLELRTCINGEMVVIDNTQTYISDVNIGTPWNPYIIDLSEMRTGISTIAADDDDNDSDWWTLQGFKIGRKPTQPGVYIHHGKKVVIKQVK